MALKIRPIPTLQGKAAKAFVAKAKGNLSKRGTVDFSQQAIMAKNILAKSICNK